MFLFLACLIRAIIQFPAGAQCFLIIMDELHFHLFLRQNKYIVLHRYVVFCFKNKIHNIYLISLLGVYKIKGNRRL